MKILDTTNLNELLHGVRGGDERAFNALYQTYSKPLYLRILRLVRSPDAADELLQELFLRVWNHRQGIDAEKSFQAYLFTIAQNLVYNYFRKVASDQALTRQLILQATADYLDGQELLENKQAAALLQAAIDQLSPQRRQVFNLCKLEGKSYQEAGELLGISVATVNSHITKSTQLIREYLLKHQDVAFLLLATSCLCTISAR